MDQTPLSSAMVASVYVPLRGVQQRMLKLQKHIADQEDLICLSEDLVERGLATSIDLQSLISFQGTLKATSFQLQTQADKLMYQLAPLVKLEVACLAKLLCQEGPLPTPLLDVPCGVCTDLLSYDNNEERVRALQQAQEAAYQAYEMTKDLYTRGLKSSIDLLNVHRTLITAEDDLIQGQVDLLSDYITLYNRY
jgi:outer membrane protein TolC